MVTMKKFITSEGSIVYSEKDMHIQAGESKAITVPLCDVYAIRLKKPSEDNNGCVSVETVDGHQYEIGLGDVVFQDAVNFFAHA